MSVLKLILRLPLLILFLPGALILHPMCWAWDDYGGVKFWNDYWELWIDWRTK